MVLKKTVFALLSILLCILLVACGIKQIASKPQSGTSVKFEDTEWSHYEGYGLSLDYPSTWAIFNYIEQDDLAGRAVLAVNEDETIFIRCFISIFSEEITCILSPSDNAEAELFYREIRNRAKLSKAVPQIPEGTTDDEILPYIEAFDALSENTETPLPEFTGTLPKKEAVSLEAAKISDDGSLAAAKDAESGLYGYIDRTGNWVIEPSFDSANGFSQGLTIVLIAGEDSYKYIDRTGAVVIEGADNEGYLNRLTKGAYTEPFSENFAAVYLDNGLSQDMVYIDTKGKIVIDAKYIPKFEGSSYANEFCFARATPFKGGFAAVQRSLNTPSLVSMGIIEDTYIIGADGKPVASISGRYSVDTKGFDDNMLLRITEKDKFALGELYGLCDIKGKIVVPMVYESLQYCENGLYAAKKNGVWGFIDKHGNTVIDFLFEEVMPFTDKLAAVKIDDSWGFIDESGSFVINAEYNEVSSLEQRLGSHLYGAAFCDGVASVKKGEYWGLIDTTGKEITGFTYKDTGLGYSGSPFESASHGVVVYRDGERYGLLTTDEKQITETIFESVSSFYNAQ